MRKVENLCVKQEIYAQSREMRMNKREKVDRNSTKKS